MPVPALTAESYVGGIREQYVEPIADNYGDQFIFMHENRRPHAAQVVGDYLYVAGIATLW